MLLFSVPGLAVLLIMVAKVATEAVAVLEITDTVRRVAYMEGCRLGIFGTTQLVFGTFVLKE